MGKLLDWDNMPPVGTPVVFKGYLRGNHSHWGFEVGKTYYVGDEFLPPRNYGNDFIFELKVGGEFTINKGDYIDSREFTREECERFCELAVENGFGRGEWLNYFGDGYFFRLGVSSVNNCGSIKWGCKVGSGYGYDVGNNITTQFREFLDKEKGKMFTKDDLKDGMLVTMKGGCEFYVCGSENMLAHQNYQMGLVYHNDFSLKRINDDLTHDCHGQFDIIKVTDRDGTVLFEREEAPRELTIEEIAKAFNLPVERVRIKK